LYTNSNIHQNPRDTHAASMPHKNALRRKIFE
jgi:hypothetical protein